MAEAVIAGERRAGADAAGVVALGACATWALVTAAHGGGRPEGILLAVLAIAAGHSGARIAGALLPVGAPAAGAVAGVVWILLAPRAARVPDGPMAPAGAGGTAAVLALSAGAACCAACASLDRARDRGGRGGRTDRGDPFHRPAGVGGVVRARWFPWLPAVALAAVAAVLGSPAGVVACLVVVGCSLGAHRVSRSWGLTGLAAGTTAAAALTWAVAAGAVPNGLRPVLDRLLTPHRLLLWRDALDLALAHPGLGVGPGRFGDLSPTLAAAGDARPHSALLQQASEQGLAGVVLLGAGYCWILHALWRSPRPTPVVLTAGAALTVLSALALAGNALSSTMVTASAGMLAGFATARPLDRDRAPDRAG